LPDGSFRYWYASRKAPPFLNLYFAINTARWTGPPALLRLPPEKGDTGVLPNSAPGLGDNVDVLEVPAPGEAIVRAWYEQGGDLTFVDLWLHGIDTSALAAGAPGEFKQAFQMAGYKLFDTTCGKRSLPLLQPYTPGASP
jgi:hypothetical protein